MRHDNPTDVEIWQRLLAVPPHRLAAYGNVGVPGTIKLMREAALGPRGEGHPGMMRLVHSIMRGVRQKDYVAEVAALNYWLCRNYRYTRDPVHVEVVRDPIAFCENKLSGDCDDTATFLAAGVNILGCPARFVTAGFRRTPEPEFTHVFTEAFISRNNCWVVVDPVAGPMTSAMLKAMVWRRNYPLDTDMGNIETIKLAA